MIGLKYLIAAVTSLSVLQVVRFSKARQDKQGLLGKLFRLIARIPTTAAPIIGAALVLGTDRISSHRRTTTPEEELDRLRRRLEVLEAISPEQALRVTERTKLDIRLRSLGFGELPSSELDIVQAAVENLQGMEQEPDWQELQVMRQRLEGVEVSEGGEEELERTRFEVEEAQELFKLVKALNGLAEDMEEGRAAAQEAGQRLVTIGAV